MRTEIKYEWTLETIDENGDIIDSDFSETLNFEDIEGKDLGLVRNEGNDADGLTDRVWAYVKDGKLPEYFSDERQRPISIKVPQRFHKEFDKYFKLLKVNV